MKDPLAEIDARFVELWGAMSSLWGVTPTMARIHGLLLVTGETLSADNFMDRLGISRGNVSMNLAKLVDWGLVRRVHHRGDRRDHFASQSDVWELFARVVSERKRREIDPLLSTLRDCRKALENIDSEGAAERRRRIEDLLTILELLDHLAQQFFAGHKGLRAALENLANDSG